MLANDSQIAEMCGNFHFNFYDILQFYSLAQKTFDFFSVRLRIFLKKLAYWHFACLQVLDMMSIGHRKRIFASLRRGREEDSQHDVIDHLPTATGVSSFRHWLIHYCLEWCNIET